MSPSAATRVEWSRRLAQALIETGQVAELDANAALAESEATGVSLGSLLATYVLETVGPQEYDLVPATLADRAKHAYGAEAAAEIAAHLPA